MRPVFPIVFAAAWAVLGCQGKDPVVRAETRMNPDGTPISIGMENVPPAFPEYQDLSPNASKSHAIVLMYHDVVPERTEDTERYDITIEQFREDLQFIVDNGGVFVGVQDLYDNLVNDKPLPHRAVVLTFDDNYQGVADNAVPILREFDAPWAMFVHTDFVGNTTRGRPKMTWETLKKFVASAKLTVGGHTASHPDDLSLVEDAQKKDEMVKSFQAVESNMGKKTPFMAWANGKFDENSKWYAQEAGYRMSFNMESGLTGTSPHILEVNRYPWQKLRLAWDEREKFLKTEPIWQPVEMALTAPEVNREDAQLRSSGFIALTGGLPETVLIDGRKQVGDLVEEFGGVGGINGGYFVLADVAATDNKMIGPCIVSNLSDFIGSAAAESGKPKLIGRPLVLWNEKTLRVVPYDPFLMVSQSDIEEILPQPTNVFLAGCWLVCDGVALSKDQILKHGPSDAMDWRKRTMIGWKADGTPVCAVSTRSVSAEYLALGAIELGCVHAVMLDSGFSTSMVYKGEVLQTGHSNKDHASRPVPHAIIIKQSPNATEETDGSEPRDATGATHPGDQ